MSRYGKNHDHDQGDEEFQALQASHEGEGYDCREAYDPQNIDGHHRPFCAPEVASEP
jgi:hypothetical protein